MTASMSERGAKRDGDRIFEAGSVLTVESQTLGLNSKL